MKQHNSSEKRCWQSICWVGEKPKDEHNETKLYLHCDWTIIILKCFVWINLAAPSDIFIKMCTQ